VLQGLDLVRTFTQGPTTTTVLHGVSLGLRRGEVVVLMGPSGSGKSTLLAVLSGLLPPSGGRVLALGEDLWGLGEAARERFRQRHFGFIFQGYNLLAALTARQQLEVVLRWAEGAARHEARARAGEMLERLDLGGRVGLRPDQLSGGEKQRVAIGRALVMRPAVCFADEPTSALDWGHGEGVMRLLRAAAHEDGTTVVVVSHDTRVLPYADRCLHLEDGRLTSEVRRQKAEGSRQRAVASSQ
jgi:putative ABC transport system ATP-binding protein